MFYSSADHCKRPFHLKATPVKIVSLVPSLTELLCDLGMEQNIAGITRFCVHPEHLKRQKVIIGGTKNVDFNKVLTLNPDLIIASKEENTEETVNALSSKIPVFVTDIDTLEKSLDFIIQLGEITEKQQRAQEIVIELKQIIEEKATIGKQRKVLYLIWKNPWLAAGNDCYINNMLTACQWRNVIQMPRYPDISDLQVAPDVVMLSSEPYPFKKEHIPEVQQMFPNAEVILTDGEFFSWYGSRLLHL
jgi:ABC-type Fe3+-hydroxamate transport system substrate-binding protein